MSELAEKTEEINDLLERRKGKQEEVRKKQLEREDIYEKQYETVVDTLYSLQESLDDEETLTLVETEEWTRGGNYTFREVLTPEGMVAEPYDLKPYFWSTEEEPLDIEEEYLVGRRARPTFLDKITERLNALAEEQNYIPENSEHLK